MFSPDRAALLLVDVQKAFEDPAFGTRNNPDCEANVGRLLAHWRERGGTVVFVRHDSTEPGSSLQPSQPGNAFQPVSSGGRDLL
jgi:nicotinamidase-related amidase